MTAYRGLNDEALVILLKKGNHNAYTEIYNRYKAIMFSHAYKKLGNASETQDVLQDVFLLLWNRREFLNAEDNISGYLYTAVRNRILNVFSHKKIRDIYEDSLLKFAVTAEIPTDYRIREHQLITIIDEEINSMPQKMKEIFLLSRKSNLKNKEIADLLNLSEHTVATQIKRALKLLRLRLGIVLYIIFLMKF